MLTRTGFSCLKTPCYTSVFSVPITHVIRRKGVGEHPPFAFLRGVRHYPAVTRSASPAETFEVPCRSNGSVTLTLYPPLSKASPAPLILYLPSGPVLKDLNSASDDQVIAALSASSNATVVRINYRAGTGTRYPLPIHDVLTGYDWTKEMLADTSEPSKIHNIGVCGQLVGGSLAAALALTECQLGRIRIAAAALNAPVVDWIFPNGNQEPTAGEADLEVIQLVKPRTESRGRKKKRISSWEEHYNSEQLPASSLLKARAALFKTADSYFDPFASPIHFFRTPGIEVPEDLSRLPYDPHRKAPDPIPRRKSRRAYPPAGSGLVLPATRLSVGDASILRSQSEDFIDMLQSNEVSRALKQSGLRLGLIEKYADLEAPQKAIIDSAVARSEKKFILNSVPGIGLWGLGKERLWREDVISTGQWLREVLAQ